MLRLPAPANMFSKAIVPADHSNSMNKWSRFTMHRMFNCRGCRDVLVERSFFHDDVQVLLSNDQVQIFKRVAIDQEQVSDVAFLHLAELVAHAHHLAADASAALQGLVRREAKQVDKMFEIASVVALR